MCLMSETTALTLCADICTPEAENQQVEVHTQAGRKTGAGFSIRHYGKCSETLTEADDAAWEKVETTRWQMTSAYSENNRMHWTSRPDDLRQRRSS